MGTARSMARNTVAMLGSQVATWSATFVLTVHLPRALGAGGYGKLSFLTALMGMFAILIDFGTTRLMTREVARDRDRAPAYLANVLALKLATAALAYAALAGTALLLPRSSDLAPLMLILGVGMILGAVAGVLQGLLQAFEQVHYLAWGEVMDKVLLTGILLALLRHGAPLPALLWGMVAVSAVTALRNGWLVLRVVRPDWRLVSPRFIRQVLTGSLSFFLFSVFARIYDKVDVALLALWTSDVVVGWYGAAYRLFDSLFFLPYIAQTVAYPVLSRLSVGDPARYHEAVRRCWGVLAAAAVGVSVTTLILSGPLVELLYTRERFPGTAAALRVLAAALGIQYLNSVLVMVLQTSDRQAKWAKAGAVAAVVNPAVNIALIPLLGHVGAAIATVFTEATLGLLALRACPPGILGRRHALAVGRALLAGVPLAAALLLGLRWGLFPAAAIGLPVYALAVLRLGVISRSDLALMRAAVALRVKREG